ncbi:hypothetical protein EAG_10932 [Camponotus floridanus]|uniref:Uncharacterized protein n=1 Tax=Camponotus floridanus TaxID=104421 RepID=E2ALR6_CAMFO|nr:hypothetical protein EAG_10932 [Camponotus floridanus]
MKGERSPYPLGFTRQPSQSTGCAAVRKEFDGPEEPANRSSCLSNRFYSFNELSIDANKRPLETIIRRSRDNVDLGKEEIQGQGVDEDRASSATEWTCRRECCCTVPQNMKNARTIASSVSY